MNLYVYSDESGVMDVIHNDYFIFGGLIFVGSSEKEIQSRKYASVEGMLRRNKGVPLGYELKATQITNKEKGKLFRSLNGCHKFGVIIEEKRIDQQITMNKKTRQRYLDYVYKIAVKRAFENLIARKIINPNSIERIYFRVDEHTTATDGRYELRESLEQEFKHGTVNFARNTSFPPIFHNLVDVQLKYCNSKAELLVRASDIIANRIYYLARQQKFEELKVIQNLHVIKLP